MKRFWVLCGLALMVLSGCNEPPLYGTKAKKFLTEMGVDAATIKTLKHHRPLPETTLRTFAKYQNPSVLFYVAANPATPVDLLENLVQRDSLAIRTGIAINRAAPLSMLRSLRTIGSYSTLNTALARNPQLSPDELRDMFANGEASKSSFAMNPACPRDIMEKIIESGVDGDIYWLRLNPSLPEDLKTRLGVKSN